MTDERTPQFRVVTPDDIKYTSKNPMKVELTSSIHDAGMEVTELLISPPTHGVMKAARNRAFESGKRQGLKNPDGTVAADNDVLFEQLLLKCARIANAGIDPIGLTPDAIDAMSTADYVRIQNEMSNAGFFGTIPTT